MSSLLRHVWVMLALGIACTPIDRKLGELTVASKTGEGGAGAGSALGGAPGSGGAPETDPSFRVYSAVWGNELGASWVAGADRSPDGKGDGFVSLVVGAQVSDVHRVAEPLHGLWGCDSTTLHAVGRVAATHVEGWVNRRLPDGVFSFADVWAQDCTTVVAVGDEGAIAWFDGDAWRPDSSGTSTYLHGVWGAGPAEVFAVGDDGVIVQYDGAEWTPMTSGTSLDLSGVWGTGPNEIYVVGGSEPEGGYVILEYDGTTWLVAAQGEGAQLRSVHGNASGVVFAVGGTRGDDDVAGLIMRRSALGWVEVPVPTSSYLWDVWVDAVGNSVAVGEADTILHLGIGDGRTTYAVPSQLATCRDGEEALVALPVLDSEPCVDTTNPVVVACAPAGTVLDGDYRCKQHVPSAVRFLTRISDDQLDAGAWRDCALAADLGSCHAHWCDRPPPLHYCTPTSFCSQLSCGVGSLDTRGCQRRPCAADSGCGTGERCLEVDVPLFGLCAQDTPGDCRCAGLGDSTKEKYCVPTL